ncbi:MAG: type II toxin-antitoxin system VapB family antitoxin [Leucobacter sp.]
MTQTTVFLNNRTQAVRLPKGVAFPDSVRLVDVRVVGNSRTITSVGESWDYWLEHGTPVTDDYCATCEQPLPQERNWSE